MDEFFFKDRSGAQNGPVSLGELVALVRSGRVAPDCLVWAEGIEPTRADAFDALAEAFRDRHAAEAPIAGRGPMRADFPVWGLFWRLLAFGVSIALILPAPWVGVWFYRWLAERIALPSGERLRLMGAVKDSWHIFAGLGVTSYLDPATQGTDLHLPITLIGLFANIWLGLALIGWFTRSLWGDRNGVKLSFAGGYWPYFGWVLLFGLSMLTVIGWAWAAKYQMRWLARQVRGSHSFEFAGTGVEILWRTLVLALGMGLLIPAPWALRWFSNWWVGQFIATPDAASQVQAQRMAA